MSTSSLTTKSSNRVPHALIWKQPPSLWLIPLISLFIMSTIPLIASKGLGWSIGSHALVLIVMSVVLAHRFFGFVHDMAACDFYFALPGRRSKMFFHLNLASMTYLIGPSALIALLNSLLFTLINVLHPVPPDAYTGMMFFFTIGASEPLTALSVIALYLKIIYLFLFLELFYLLSDKAGRANTMALLINLFWPIVIYFYTDATVRFLPGFPDRVEPLGMPSAPWYELLFRQILSPLSAVITTLDFYEHFWVYAILPIAAWLLCRHFFIKRQVEYARLSTKMNWPFAITQWIGMLSVTLIGGYACHHLRAIIYDATKAEPNVMTPAPFLIGCGLGLILSLWIFNLIRGKGKLAWKPLIAAFLAVLIPFSAWLGVVMSGANGYSDRWPEDDRIRSIEIYYPDGSYVFQETNQRVVALKEQSDIADVSALVRQVFNEDNLGLRTPHTLQSRTLSDAYVLSLLQPQHKNAGSLFFIDITSFWSELSSHYVDLICHTTDGATIRRKMVLPYNPANPHYRELLLRNNRFLLAEYGGTPSHLGRYEHGLYEDLSTLDGVLHTTLSVETTKDNLTKAERVWQSRLVAMVSDEQYEEARVAEFFAQNLCKTAAHDLLSQDADAYKQLVDNAPFIVHIHITYTPNNPDTLPAKADASTDVGNDGNADTNDSDQTSSSDSQDIFNGKTNVNTPTSPDTLPAKTDASTDTINDGYADTNDSDQTTTPVARIDLKNTSTPEYNLSWSADLVIPVNPESKEMARFLEDMWLFMRVYVESER